MSMYEIHSTAYVFDAGNEKTRQTIKGWPNNSTSIVCDGIDAADTLVQTIYGGMKASLVEPYGPVVKNSANIFKMGDHYVDLTVDHDDPKDIPLPREFQKFELEDRDVIIDVRAVALEEPEPIYTRQEAANIIEFFEDVLDANDITVPSPEDDDKDEDNEARLYGSVYYDLLDEVETAVEALIRRHVPGQRIITDTFNDFQPINTNHGEEPEHHMFGIYVLDVEKAAAEAGDYHRFHTDNFDSRDQAPLMIAEQYFDFDEDMLLKRVRELAANPCSSWWWIVDLGTNFLMGEHTTICSGAMDPEDPDIVEDYLVRLHEFDGDEDEPTIVALAEDYSNATMPVSTGRSIIDMLNHTLVKVGTRQDDDIEVFGDIAIDYERLIDLLDGAANCERTEVKNGAMVYDPDVEDADERITIDADAVVNLTTMMNVCHERLGEAAYDGHADWKNAHRGFLICWSLITGKEIDFDHYATPESKD